MRMQSGNADLNRNANKSSHEMLLVNNQRNGNRDVYDRYANAINEELKDDVKEAIRSQKSEMSPMR